MHSGILSLRIFSITSGFSIKPSLIHLIFVWITPQTKSSKVRNISKDTMTKAVKEFLRLSGIDVVGIARVEKEDLYTFRGFSKKNYNYGDVIEYRFEYAIVFAVAIELDYINRSPSNETFMGAMLALILH